MTSNKTESKRLFIGSLPYRFTEGELLSLFVPFGKVLSVRIMHNKWGKSRGLGFVEFEDLESAIAAKTKMHNHPLGERTIIVDYAQPDPFLTPEGQQRHEEALQKKGKKRRNLSDYGSRESNFTPKNFDPNINLKPRRSSEKPEGTYAKKYKGKKIRQSVFESREFGSKTGAKFAAKSRRGKK